MRGWFYSRWQTNILKVEDEKKLMSFSYCWYKLGSKKQEIKCRTLYDMDTYNVDPEDDTLLVKELWKLFDEADVLVGHNSNKFDNKVAMGMFLRSNLLPPSPFKQIDTLQQARKIGVQSSNSLDNLGTLYKIGNKSKTKHSDVWYECFIGHDKKAWKEMAIYNNQDVQVTVNLYEKLLPYMKGTPNLSRIANRPDSCPKCLSDHIQRHGTYTTQVSIKAQWQCMSCGNRFSSRIAYRDYDGDIKPRYQNI